jgi:hypothetical protein
MGSNPGVYIRGNAREENEAYLRVAKNGGSADNTSNGNLSDHRRSLLKLFVSHYTMGSEVSYTSFEVVRSYARW